jgi:hypothetical protein
MQKLKTFWYSLKRTLTDFNYYKDILDAPFNFSLKYLALLLFIIAFIQGLFFAGAILTLVPKVPAFARTVQTSAQSFYPADLVVTVKNGNISINKDQPYYIAWPPMLKTQDNPESKGKSHFITIDTKAKIEDFQKYNTAVLVTKNAIVSDSSQGVRVNFLDNMKGNLTINRKVYDQTLQKIVPFLNYASVLLIIGAFLVLVFVPFFILFFVLIYQLIYLLFGAGVVWLISKVMNVNLSYTKVYQLCMHAITIPIVLTTVGEVLLVHIPFLFTGILAIWMVFVFRTLQPKPEV